MKSMIKFFLLFIAFVTYNDEELEEYGIDLRRQSQLSKWKEEKVIS